MPINPLGKSAAYPDRYAPELLFAVARIESRSWHDADNPLPFHGRDLWNAWELTWLDSGGKPVVATGVIDVPAESPNLIESKSLKLYLNSLAMTPFASVAEVERTVQADLSGAAGAEVTFGVSLAGDCVTGQVDCLPGTCIDGQDIRLQHNHSSGEVCADALQCAEGGEVVDESLHSHLLRSNCPVTNQPDIGSILVRYRGARIDAASLLRYLVSYRQHNDFHEACVERIFLDIKRRCQPQALTVYARYNRRGGLDINPFRSDFESSVPNLRLWRQ